MSATDTLPVNAIQPEARRTPRLGDLLVAEGLVTPIQLEEALRLQRSLEAYTPLGHILVDQKLVTRDQLLSVLERHRRSSRLGDVLTRSGNVDTEQLQAALVEQRHTGQPLGQILVGRGVISEEGLRLALCRQLHIRFFDLDGIIIDPTLRTLVNEKFAMKHRVVPVACVGNVLVLAMDDPTATRVVDELQRTTGFKTEIITSTSASIGRALERLYRAEVRPRLTAGEKVEVIADGPAPTTGTPTGSRRADTADALVRKLLRVAIDRGASDIHLESVDRRLRARFRIDGVLQHFNLGDLGDDLTQLRSEVVSRLKILSNLDIAEHRRPQDGSFRARVEIEGRILPMDFRISVIPGYYGENVVVRILDPRRAPESLDALGLTRPITDGLRQLARLSTGMLLVTGPTGSGKSTTLYGLLRTLYRPEIKVLTAEDPIEYVCEQFCQHEVDERRGNTFARYLRSFLRHDPEVIMIGEIRDRETAELAFRAAQTGHLVLSTLHTNDAISAVTRLTDLGVDTNVCTSSLLGVLAQRLVRAVCWNCKEEYEPSLSLIRAVFDEPPAGGRWYRGAGCAACHHTGYRGRLALAELWTPGDEDVFLINRGAGFDDIRRAADKHTVSMVDDVIGKLREGRTSLEEIVRVLPQATLRALRSVALA